MDKKTKNQSEAEFRELCEKVRLLGHNCDNCAYGSQCGHDASQCPRHLTACLSFVAAPSEEQASLGGDAVRPLVRLYKAFIDKVRQCFLKIRGRR
ncbi:MAG: hypothetical protein IKO23_09525 [Bacteroidales bacterium]|nr:hypothetical protein [Bacteroidales bacterium]